MVVQALVFPLTVASKSTNKGRSQNALELVQQLKEHYPVLVDQAKLVSPNPATLDETSLPS